VKDALRLEYRQLRREGAEMFLYPRSTLFFPESSNKSSIAPQAAFPVPALKWSDEKYRAVSTGPQGRKAALSRPKISARHQPEISAAP
jgi:hypothetical protein